MTCYDRYFDTRASINASIHRSVLENKMMLYLLTIQEIRNVGVLITAITETGEVREIRQEYTPWLVTVGLPKRYYKDSRKAKVEATNLK